MCSNGASTPLAVDADASKYSSPFSCANRCPSCVFDRACLVGELDAGESRAAVATTDGAPLLDGAPPGRLGESNLRQSLLVARGNPIPPHS